MLIANDENYVTLVCSRNRRRIVIETKTGKSIDLPQLARYLYGCDVLILVRVSFGHVVSLRRQEVERFLCEDLKDLIAKGRRIMDGQLVIVKGRECFGCQASCEFAKPGSSRMIALDNESFQEDLASTFRNVYTLIDRVVELVMDELQDAKAGGV